MYSSFEETLGNAPVWVMDARWLSTKPSKHNASAPVASAEKSDQWRRGVY